MFKPFIIGLTGGSGAGKTSFIHQLKAEFTPQQICFISQDDYYRPREEQKLDEQGVKNFDLPRSIDKKAFAKDLQRLIAGETVERREYVFNNELAKPRLLIFRPSPVILVEGLFIFHIKRIRKLVDLKIFIQAKENLKVIRRIKRDRLERNYPLEDVLYRYENHVMPTFEKYIRPYIDQCDIIVNNNEDFSMGMEVIKGFLHQKIKSLPREGAPAGEKE